MNDLHCLHDGGRAEDERSALLTIGEIAESSTVLHIGGFFGLAAAACAWYGSAGGVVNPAWGCTVLPVHPMARG